MNATLTTAPFSKTTARTLLLMLLLACTLTAKAQLQTKVNPDGSLTVTGGCVSGALEILGAIDARPVTVIGNSAFIGCTGLTSVVIPGSVTEIGDAAFYGCTGLTSAVIPDSVTRIGDTAFHGCADLTSIVIPDSVTEIGDAAFGGCTGLTSVVIPDSVTEIGGYAFGGCTVLTAIEVAQGNHAYSTSEGVLYNKTRSILLAYPGAKAGAFAIPYSVTRIGDAAFGGCTGLTSVVIPDSVTEIGDAAFSGCTGLTGAVIPDSVTSIGGYAFSGCTGLTSMVIPDSVTEIGDAAFYGCTSLTNVVIGNSVTEIGNSAFGDCTGLTKVVIGDSVTEIERNAFYGCTGLTEIEVAEENPAHSSSEGVLYNKARSILLAYPGAKAGAFAIPDSVTEIGYDAFHGCTGLTSVVIPDSVTRISDYAFGGCTGLTSVVIPDSVSAIGHRAFYGCTDLTAIEVAEENPAYSSSDGVLYNKARSDLLAYPGAKAGAFAVPDSVTWISDSAFGGCTGLTGVVIPDSVTIIWGRGFLGCTDLTAIEVAEENPAYSSSDGVLYNKARSVLLAYPGAKAGAFAIPDSVTRISDSAFDGCTCLTSVVIPDSVSSIGFRAFYGCAGLTSVYFEGNKPIDVGSAVFYGSTATIFRLADSSGWGPMFAELPTVVWAPEAVRSGTRLQGGRFTFPIWWARNRKVVVEAASNLGDPEWTEAGTLTTRDDGLAEFVDSEPAEGVATFYRVRGK